MNGSRRITPWTSKDNRESMKRTPCAREGCPRTVRPGTQGNCCSTACRVVVSWFSEYSNEDTSTDVYVALVELSDALTSFHKEKIKDYRKKANQIRLRS
mgnify:CR=1 FL=1